MEKNNILVRDLCKQFDEFLLDHVSFQVPKGRIVGFIGENGAGKSTTINLILDELKKDNGQIQIFGREHTSSSVKEDIGIAALTLKFILTLLEYIGFYFLILLYQRNLI